MAEILVKKISLILISVGLVASTIFSNCPDALALSLAPVPYEEVRMVPITELDKSIGQQKTGEDIRMYVLARFHQIAYARKPRFLPVEMWGGNQFYPWVHGDPGEERVLPPKTPEEERSAREHLKKAVQYFSKVIELPAPKVVIGGLQGTFENRQIRAYRGLIWSLHQEGRGTEAETLYSRYMSLVMEQQGYDRDHEILKAWLFLQPYVGPDWIQRPTIQKIERIAPEKLTQRWEVVAAKQPSKLDLWKHQADLYSLLYDTRADWVWISKTSDSLGFHRVVTVESPAATQVSHSDESRDQRLKDAIALYEKILAMPEAEHKQQSKFPPLVKRERLEIKRALTHAKAKKQSKQQSLPEFQSLLEESLDYDVKHREDGSAFSVTVWNEMQEFLDPKEHAVYIQKTKQRLKDADIQQGISSLFY